MKSRHKIRKQYCWILTLAAAWAHILAPSPAQTWLLLRIFGFPMYLESFFWRNVSSNEPISWARLFLCLLYHFAKLFMSFVSFCKTIEIPLVISTFWNSPSKGNIDICCYVVPLLQFLVRWVDCRTRWIMPAAGEILHILHSSTLKNPLNEIDGNLTFFYVFCIILQNYWNSIGYKHILKLSE